MSLKIQKYITSFANTKNLDIIKKYLKSTHYDLRGIYFSFPITSLCFLPQHVIQILKLFFEKQKTNHFFLLQ